MKEIRLELNKSNYNDFIRCLQNLKDICNDVQIDDGIIRQRNNENTAIFEFDMSAILSDVSLTLTDIKQKLDLLKTFQDTQDVNIYVAEPEDEEKEGPGFFEFSDTFSSIRCMAPNAKYVDNKFITLEELTSISSFDENDLILERELSNIITNRMRVVSTNFNVKSIRIDFQGETASITAATQAKSESAKFITGIPINEMIIQNSFSNIPVVPFCIDHDTAIEFKMFKEKDPSSGNTVTNKISTTLGQVDIKIFSRSSILTEE
jgi:hypothetical protein